MDATNGVVLFIEIPGLRPLPDASALSLASHGARTMLVSGKAPALEVLHQTNTSGTKLVAIILNAPDLELTESIRALHPKASTILVTGDPMPQYAQELQGRDDEVLDHVIANTTVEWTIDELRVTLQKLLRNDIFGIEKHLTPNTPITQHTITSSRDREHCNQSIQRWIEACGQNKSIGRQAFGIVEELVMNAVYDAPPAGGRVHYDHLERNTQRDLQADEYATLRYGCDGRILAISMEDPFGAFSRDKWWYYARKILKRDDTNSLIDTKKGGAGLGLFKMLYSSHGVVCNVEPGKRTEVIVLIDLNQPLRDFSQMPRSIHYFNFNPQAS